MDSSDITTMYTPKLATNIAKNKVLKYCIPNITMSFQDDIGFPIKGFLEDKDETFGFQLFANLVDSIAHKS